MLKKITSLILFSVIFSLAGCGTVQPWERDYLAKPEMSFDPRPLDTAFRHHMYFSREATADGYSAAGGGCGCN